MYTGYYSVLLSFCTISLSHVGSLFLSENPVVALPLNAESYSYHPATNVPAHHGILQGGKSAVSDVAYKRVHVATISKAASWVFGFARVMGYKWHASVYHVKKTLPSETVVTL